MICKEYTKKFPDRPIYMFSSLPDDVSVDDIKNLKRPKIDDTLVSDPIEANEFAESMVIFDDCDTLSNKAQERRFSRYSTRFYRRGDIIRLVVFSHSIYRATARRPARC
jgi:hypothetical protein